jgi:signal transduction histidine kinase
MAAPRADASKERPNANGHLLRPQPATFDALNSDPLEAIPSPSRRLWIGLCIILSIFIIFAAYTTYEVRWLERFQVNVVQRNRKASLQLLRLQNDSYLVAISLREMTDSEPRYPIPQWRAEFSRLHADMDDAARLEASYAVKIASADDKRQQLAEALPHFWQSLDRVFLLAGAGQEDQARSLARAEVEQNRAIVSEIVNRLLVLNDQAQGRATETINGVYSHVKRDILVVVGVLFFLALATGFYTLQANRRTFEKLQHLAGQLHAQSGQLRRLSWKLIEVQEEMLRQVSRDLHDEFGQILTAVGVLLSRAGRTATGAEVTQDLDVVRKIVQETLQKVRDQSQMFRPAILDDFGLTRTLEWFCEQFSRQTGIRVHLKAEISEGVLSPEAPIHLYRIVQEALSNATRHSGTREAWVNIGAQNGNLCLEIRDNGRGFDPHGESRSAGAGLMGIRERAEHLHGSLDLRSSPGSGTAITVRIPLLSELENNRTRSSH